MDPGPNDDGDQARPTNIGRPTKFTQLNQARFLRLIEAGVPPEVAARSAGFSPASMYRWLGGSTLAHAEFRALFLEARANLEIRLEATILRAAATDPRWAQYILERMFPERWRVTRRADEAADEERLEPAKVEQSVVLDPALIAELVPRLLEAGRRARGEDPSHGPTERLGLGGPQPGGRSAGGEP